MSKPGSPALSPRLLPPLGRVAWATVTQPHKAQGHRLLPGAGSIRATLLPRPKMAEWGPLGEPDHARQGPGRGMGIPETDPRCPHHCTNTCWRFRGRMHTTECENRTRRTLRTSRPQVGQGHPGGRAEMGGEPGGACLPAPTAGAGHRPQLRATLPVCRGHIFHKANADTEKHPGLGCAETRRGSPTSLRTPGQVAGGPGGWGRGRGRAGRLPGVQVKE